MRSAARCAVVGLAAMVAAPLCGQTAAPAAICGGMPDGGAASYLLQPVQRMRADVPDLRGLKAEESGNAESILQQTGAMLSGMIGKVPNLLAAEELSQASVKLPYTVAETQQTGSGPAPRGSNRSPGTSQLSSDSHSVTGRDLDQVLDSMLKTTAKRRMFQYRVVSTPDPVLGSVLEEYRTNAENESVVLSGAPGGPQGVGFSKEWLLFLPANLAQSRLRYLGRQKIDGRETEVVAFAEIPEKVRLPAEIQTGVATCPYFTQGVVWIDRAESEIVRLQTDLLAPVPGIELRQLRTQTHFGEVKIAGVNLRLWMPMQTEILWSTKDNAGGELHRYSGYKLFGSKVTLKAPTDE